MAEPDPYFPPDLLIEILLNLPIKSLARFTVISKSWYYRVTSPSFISTHLTKTPNTLNTLLIRYYQNTNKKEHYELFQDFKNIPFCLNLKSQFNFPFNSQLGYFRIVGSCNGIICLCDDLFGESKRLVFWNPCVRKFTTLPLPSISPKLPHMFVLGFGGDVNDYKLVRLVYYKADDALSDYKVPPEVEIYRLSTGVWRRVIGVGVKHCVVDYMWSQAFLNGLVHWIAYNVGDDGAVWCLVMSFSIADEAFGEIILPDALVGEAATNLSIMVFDGCLAVVKYAREIDVGSCEVWVMKLYGVLESWTILYCLNLDADVEKVVGFRSNGEVLFSTSGYELVSYDPNTGDRKDLGISGSPRSFYVHNYVESLVLLQGNNGVLQELLDGIGSLWI